MVVSPWTCFVAEDLGGVEGRESWIVGPVTPDQEKVAEGKRPVLIRFDVNNARLFVHVKRLQTAALNAETCWNWIVGAAYDDG